MNKAEDSGACAEEFDGDSQLHALWASSKSLVAGINKIS